jgi:hypothetical protein
MGMVTVDFSASSVVQPSGRWLATISTFAWLTVVPVLAAAQSALTKSNFDCGRGRPCRHHRHLPSRWFLARMGCAGRTRPLSPPLPLGSIEKRPQRGGQYAEQARLDRRGNRYPGRATSAGEPRDRGRAFRGDATGRVSEMKMSRREDRGQANRRRTAWRVRYLLIGGVAFVLTKSTCPLVN